MLSLTSVKSKTFEVSGNFLNTSSDEIFSQFGLPESGPVSGPVVALALALRSCGQDWHQVSSEEIVTIGYITSQGRLDTGPFEDIDVFEDARSLSIGLCAEEIDQKCSEMKRVFACADLEPVATSFQLSRDLVIVLCVAGAIFLVVAILLPMVYCCTKRWASPHRQTRHPPVFLQLPRPLVGRFMIYGIYVFTHIREVHKS